MTAICGFDFPDELYYLVDKHVWVRSAGDGLVTVGLTPVAYRLLRYSLVAISVRPKVLGQEVPKGRSIAMVESLKYIGPLAAPCAGLVLRANEAVAADPTVAERDPYGAGWIVEMRPADWDAARTELQTGAPAMATYQKLLEEQKIAPE